MKPTDQSSVTVPYERTAHEQQIVDQLLERRRATAPLPRIKVDMREVRGEKTAAIDVDHPDPPTGHALLASAIGLCDERFSGGQLSFLANAANQQGTLRADLMNYGASIIAGIQPHDHVEALLGAQMAAVHIATMNMAARLGNAVTVEGRAASEKAFTRLARTFATQMDALKRYRSKGESKVFVERLDVNVLARSSPEPCRETKSDLPHDFDKIGG